MSQNNKMQGQGKGQDRQDQGQSGKKQPDTGDRGNPSITERIQPNKAQGDNNRRNQETTV